jgi:glucose-1-phosphate cytidylyltransferase
MKIIILAGGFGTRLGNITTSIPKPMVSVGNYPIIWHIMKMYGHYGYKDFVLSLGYKAEVIKDYFYKQQMLNNDFSIDLSTQKVTILPRKENHLDWKVTLIDTGLNTLKGARIKRLEKYLDDVNMLTYGDGVADIDLKALLKFHKSHGKTITITGVRPPSRFGEIQVENGRLLSFQEKPQTSVGLINGGFMVFNKNLLKYLTTDENCDLEYGAFNKLTDEGEMMVYTHDKNWECVDTERDLKHLNDLWNKNTAFWKVW